MKPAYLRAIYRHNYAVVDRFFPWLVDHKARRIFVRSVGPIVARCGDPKCPVCRTRPQTKGGRVTRRWKDADKSTKRRITAYRLDEPLENWVAINAGTNARNITVCLTLANARKFACYLLNEAGDAAPEQPKTEESANERSAECTSTAFRMIPTRERKTRTTRTSTS